MKSPVTCGVLTAAILVFALGRVPAIGAEKESGIILDLGDGFTPSATAPVPVPASLDPKYAGDGLITAFRAVAKRMGVGVRRIAVDTSEYPFLVYGVLDGRCSHEDMRRVLGATPDYAYGGSTTLIGRSETHFVLNMNPTTTYPPDQRKAIGLRFGARMKALLAKARAL
jgi:hypothetical protein